MYLGELSDQDPEVDAVFNSFWRDLLMRNGLIDMNLVKRELYDYRQVMHEVSKVYMEITGGRISKPNTMAECVLGEVEEIRNEEINEAISRSKEEA